MQTVRRLLELFAVLCVSSASASVARRVHADVTLTDGDVQVPEEDATQKMVDRAVNAAGLTAGTSTQVRLHTSHLRAAVSQYRAAQAAQTASDNVDNTLLVPPQVSASEQQAKASLAEAMSWHTKAQSLINGVQQRAYFAAKAVASAEAAKLETEAQAYYQTLVAASQALAKSGGDDRSEAAAKAAEPYVKVQLRAAAMVEAYNNKAKETLTQANNVVNQAVSLAYQATREQAYGNAEMAQRHMMQAHQLIGQAKVKKELALRIRKLVESLNTSIPSYQQAAENAVTHALAVFTGLQTATTSTSVDDDFTKAVAAFDSAMEAAQSGPLR